MGRERNSRYHDHSVRNLGCEPRPGRRLHLLRWRWLTPRPAKELRLAGISTIDAAKRLGAGD